MRRMRMGLFLLSWLACLLSAGSAFAAVLRISVAGVPGAQRGMISSLRVIRASDGRVVAHRALRAHQSISVTPGVYFISASVAGGVPPRVRAASKAIVAGRGRLTGVSLELRNARATRALATAAAAAPANAPIITADGVVLKGLPQVGQPNLWLDGALDGYLWTALNPHGVRVVDATPEFIAGAKREQTLSDQGLLATKFTFNPLKPNYFLRGGGTLNPDGTVSLDLRIVDASGTTIASVKTSGKAEDLRDLVIDAVNQVSAEAAPHLGPHSPGPGPSTYGLELSLDFRDYQATDVPGLTRDLGTGTGHVIVTGPDGTQYTVGCISEQGCATSGHWDFPAGKTVTLQAVPDRDSTFAGWSAAGDVCGGGEVCTFKLTRSTSVTAHFGAKVFVLTVNNKHPDEGTVQSGYPGAAIIGIDCGEGQTRCRAVERAYTQFTLTITSLRGQGSPQNYWIGQVDGCPDLHYNGVPPTDAAQCNYGTTEGDQTLTVDWTPEQSPYY